MHVPGRAVGPVDHSPGRNPGAAKPWGGQNPWAAKPLGAKPWAARIQRPPRRAPGPEWMNAGYMYSPRAGGPNGTYPERPVGAPDHSQGRNPWAAKPWAANPRAKPRGARVPGDVYSPPMVAPGGAYAVAPPTRVPTSTNQRASGPNHINRAARPPTLSELWTQKRITRTCSSSCCSS